MGQGKLGSVVPRGRSWPRAELCASGDAWKEPSAAFASLPLQVSIALISFLETMLLIYLSYKVRAAGQAVGTDVQSGSDPPGVKSFLCL